MTLKLMEFVRMRAEGIPPFSIHSPGIDGANNSHMNIVIYFGRGNPGHVIQLLVLLIT